MTLIVVLSMHHVAMLITGRFILFSEDTSGVTRSLSVLLAFVNSLDFLKSSSKSLHFMSRYQSDSSN